MKKLRLVLVVIALLLTITLGGFTSNNKSEDIIRYDQVIEIVEELCNESDDEKTEFILLDDKIVVDEEDRNPDIVTVLSNDSFICILNESPRDYI